MFDIPPLFEMIQKGRRTPWREMYQVFNMGHRMEIYVDEKFANHIISISKSFDVDAKVIGKVEKSDTKKLTILTEEGEFALDVRKIKILEQKFNEISDLIIKPDIISDQKKYIKISKEYKDLKEIIDKKNEYENVLKNIDEANHIVKNETDKEILELANSEMVVYKENLVELEEQLKILLIPKDPDDTKNVVMELRAGTGGDEASIFAGDLFRMYSKYAEKQGWKVNLVDFNEGTAGGYKEIIFEINGENIYGTIKFESGVHREYREFTNRNTGQGSYFCSDSHGSPGSRGI